VAHDATDDLAQMAQTLEKSGDYRVLRRLVPRDVFTSVSTNRRIKVGVLLDVETTGLNTKTDEVIELGMLKFAYLHDGRVAHVINSFGLLNEPANPILAEITAITGITNEMVAGKRIDAGAVSTFVADANIVIAHNANFDRKFAERYWPEFAFKPWGCSATEIDWRAHGFEGLRLGYLLMGAGLFHTAHRAVDDCRALLEVLAMTLAKTKQSALANLLDHARRNTVRIWAEGAPYDLKDDLRKRGYRWNDGSDGRPRSWHSLADSSKRTCHKIPRGQNVNWLFRRSPVLGHEFAEYRPADVIGKNFARLGGVASLKIDTAIPGLTIEDVAEVRL
jgi:DNA polymerase III subunit epsilon